MAREGLPFVFPFLILGILAIVLHLPWLGGLSLLLAAVFAFFFRDPRRVSDQTDCCLLSPADGRILQADSHPERTSLPHPASRISIFLSLWNVHITRAPLAGRVTSVVRRPGRYFSADKDIAGKHNACVEVQIEGEGTRLLLRQVSGAVARKIKSYIRENDTLRAGQKIGLIYFGSRVEILVPEPWSVRVRPGDNVRAGESILAEKEGTP
jgi:phosphatidylserine decarboxylase